MKYQVTLFKNQFDNQTHNRVEFDSWEKFVNWLYKISDLKGQKGGNNSSPLITPAVFSEGSTRSSKNTLYWGGWCAIDVDDHDLPSDLDQLKEHLYGKFGHIDFVVYSTASSTCALPKFRVVFRTDEHVEVDRVKSFWYALNKYVGEISDPQTKDIARMYYVPAQYPDSFNFIFDNHCGGSLNVSELIAKYPYREKTGNSFLDRLPPELQKAVVEHRKNSLDNTDFTWSSYRDCPFWPRSLATEYMNISSTGWYHKMYQIMVAIAGKAVERGYPITSQEIAQLCKDFDRETGNWYENRPMTTEADRALEYIYRNG